MLGVLWWSWVGYAWLTSVVDPEEGVVRLAIFGAMAALLVAALCVPRGVRRLGAAVRAAPTAVVRIAQIVLFVVASRDDPDLRRRSIGLAVEHGDRRRRCSWPPRSPTARSRARSGRSRSLLDIGGPYFFGAEGWRLVPEPLRRAPRADRDHRARASRSSRSASGAEAEVDAGVVVAAVLGVGRRRPRCGGCTSTSSRSSPSAGSSNAAPGASRTRSRATRTPTCTSRWSPGSCCSRSG